MKKIVFGLVAVAVLVSACGKNVVPSTEQLRADDQQVIDEQPADEGIPFRAVVSHDNIVKAISESTGEIITRWAKDEEIAMIYSVSGTPYKTVATIASVDGTGKATIEATLQSGLEDGAVVTLIYPASAADGTTGNILSSVISAQDGSFSIDRDIRKGSGTLNVEAGVATLAPGASVPAAYAIVKFVLGGYYWNGSEWDDDVLEVSSLKIKNSEGVIANVTMVAADYEVFVTLPAMTSTPLWFEAVSSAGAPYIAKGVATFEAGMFYRPNMTMCTVGNIIGANGKFYKNKASAVSNGTTAAAIIAYIGSDTAEAGYTHGLAISMKNVKGGTMRWKSDALASGIDNGSGCQYTLYSDALAAKESGVALSSIAAKNNETNYPATYKAIHNDIDLSDETGMTSIKPSSGTSDWFLPSLFQWSQIMNGLTGETSGLTTMNKTEYALGANDLVNKIAAVTGSSNCWFTNLGSSKGIHTSTEYNADNIWYYNHTSGAYGAKLAYGPKTSSLYTRAVLAF